MSNAVDRLADALASRIRSIINDERNSPGRSQLFLGTWNSAESVDANLSKVTISGQPMPSRFVPKASHVTGLSSGQTVLLAKGPGVPMHIYGILVGDITKAIV